MRTRSYKLFGKNIVSTFHHHIMSLDYSNASPPQSALTMVCVTDCPEEMIDGPYGVDTAERILRVNKGKCDIFVFNDGDGNKVGTLSVMYRGGNDIEYKIRDIDAFIYNVFTDERFRGKGYAGDMIRMLMQNLHDMNIEKAYLAVSTNNPSAVRAYVKTGFVTEKDLSFVRVLRVNIPYWAI